MEKGRWILFFTFLSFVIFIFALMVIVSSQPSFPKRKTIGLTPTPQTSTSPKTENLYINEKYKYQLVIPENWEVKNQTEDASVINILPIDYNPEEEVPVVISATQNVSNKSVDAWINSFFSENHPREKVTIGKTHWTRVRSALSTYQAVVYFTQYQGHIYELYNSILKGADGEAFHQALLTFTFIE